MREAYCASEGLAREKSRLSSRRGRGRGWATSSRRRPWATCCSRIVPPGSRCALGALKTNIGHMETASGIASLMKAALRSQAPADTAEPEFRESQSGHSLRHDSAVRSAAVGVVARHGTARRSPASTHSDTVAATPTSCWKGRRQRRPRPACVRHGIAAAPPVGAPNRHCATWPVATCVSYARIRLPGATCVIPRRCAASITIAVSP